MNKVAMVLVVGLSVAMVACTGGGGDDAPASVASAVSVVEACNAAVTCDSGTGKLTPSQLTRTTSGCYLGGIRLDPGGDVVMDDLSGAEWSATSTQVSICLDDICMDCAVAGAGATGRATAKAAGACKGLASSCYGRAAGSCSTQDGCSMTGRTRMTASGGWTREYDCEGSATSCDDFDSESSCEGQSGCRWE